MKRTNKFYTKNVDAWNGSDVRSYYIEFDYSINFQHLQRHVFQMKDGSEMVEGWIRGIKQA